MKVSIQKDGYVYIKSSRLIIREVWDIIKEIVKRDISEDISVEWVNRDNDNDSRLKCVLGVNEYPLHRDADWYCINFSSVEQWKSEMEEMIEGIADWYNKLPVDEGEIELKYTAIV